MGDVVGGLLGQVDRGSRVEVDRRNGGGWNERQFQLQCASFALLSLDTASTTVERIRCELLDCDDGRNGTIDCSRNGFNSAKDRVATPPIHPSVSSPTPLS